MPHAITPALMFQGHARDALALYARLFPDARVEGLEHHEGGTVRGATLYLTPELKLHVSDSPPVHAFTFTPSTSLFVDCEGESEFQALYAGLSDGGEVLMPPADYGFSALFAWVNDRYGVSWQLNVPRPGGA